MSIPKSQRFHVKMGVPTVITATTVTTLDYVVNLNSLYDPFEAKGSNQPAAFDQMMALYKKFKVISADIEVTGHSASDDVALGLCVLDSSTALTLMDSVTGQKYATKALPVPTSLTSTSPKWRLSIDMAAFFGRTKTEYMASDVYAGTASASPANVCYVHCFSRNFAASSSSWTINVCLNWNWLVEFYEPVQLTGT